MRGLLPHRHIGRNAEAAARFARLAAGAEINGSVERVPSQHTGQQEVTGCDAGVNLPGDRIDLECRDQYRYCHQHTQRQANATVDDALILNGRQPIAKTPRSFFTMRLYGLSFRILLSSGFLHDQLLCVPYECLPDSEQYACPSSLKRAQRRTARLATDELRKSVVLHQRIIEITQTSCKSYSGGEQWQPCR